MAFSDYRRVKYLSRVDDNYNPEGNTKPIDHDVIFKKSLSFEDDTPGDKWLFHSIPNISSTVTYDVNFKSNNNTFIGIKCTYNTYTKIQNSMIYSVTEKILGYLTSGGLTTFVFNEVIWTSSGGGGGGNTTMGGSGTGEVTRAGGGSINDYVPPAQPATWTNENYRTITLSPGSVLDNSFKTWLNSSADDISFKPWALRIRLRMARDYSVGTSNKLVGFNSDENKNIHSMIYLTPDGLAVNSVQDTGTNLVELPVIITGDFDNFDFIFASKDYLVFKNGYYIGKFNVADNYLKPPQELTEDASTSTFVLNLCKGNSIKLMDCSVNKLYLGLESSELDLEQEWESVFEDPGFYTYDDFSDMFITSETAIEQFYPCISKTDEYKYDSGILDNNGRLYAMMSETIVNNSKSHTSSVCLIGASGVDNLYSVDLDVNPSGTDAEILITGDTYLPGVLYSSHDGILVEYRDSKSTVDIAHYRFFYWSVGEGSEREILSNERTFRFYPESDCTIVANLGVFGNHCILA